MSVSIIIPAFNAAATLAETLNSVQKQTVSEWDAVIIDDGSNDATASIAETYARGDARFRVIQQKNGGVSSARNSGIRSSTGEWLCFLDSDDLIAPSYLESLLEKTASDPYLQAAYAGWVRVSREGMQTPPECAGVEGDLFSILCKRPLGAIHCCILRRSVVEMAGGFDESFVTCEDWDLHQRIARTGAKFGCVNETLAFYRMSASSLSRNAEQVLRDALRVIDIGHSADPRVSNPAHSHAGGSDRTMLSATCYYQICWVAGLMCGGGKAAVTPMDVPGITAEPGLDVKTVADLLFRSAPLPECRTVEVWPEMTSWILPEITRFLHALEKHSGSQNLTSRVLACLEEQIASLPGDFVVGKTVARDLEVAAPFSDLSAPAGCELACLKLSLLGKPLGTVHLPVFDALLPATVIKDAVASKFSWEILNRFLELALYPALHFRRDQGTLSVLRGEQELVSGMRTEAEPEEIHAALDWTLFLQELWDRPRWTVSQFYEDSDDELETLSRSARGREVVNAEDQVPSLVGIVTGGVKVDFRIAGNSLGVVEVPATEGMVSSGRLVNVLTSESGYELCCAVVREALVGEDWSTGESLRERLRRKKEENGDPRVVFRVDSCTAILPRRAPGIRGDSTARRAVLPLSAYGVLGSVATATGEPTMLLPDLDVSASTLQYRPDCLVEEFFSDRADEWRRAAGVDEDDAGAGGVRNRAHFESLFARSKDPWRYTSDYEQVKYEQTLALIPPGKVANALELACAAGHFTVQLAERTEELTAMDISVLALEEAAARCREFPHVKFAHLDLLQDEIPGSYDLVVCSEVLYYTGDESNLAAVGRKIAQALKPGGLLLMAHAHLVADDPDQPGFNWDLPFGARRIGEIVASAGGLIPVREIRTPFYRVQSFQRPDDLRQSQLDPVPPPVVEILEKQPTALPPAVAADALWKGGKPARFGCKVESPELRILMYHRVAASGFERTKRWRVTPEDFAAQLEYLSDAGYYSPSLEMWQEAAKQKKPLPGRAVILTFDDGYLDFYTDALPLLRRFGFKADVFVVARAVGSLNQWDSGLGEEIELMDWHHLKELRALGFGVGSHTASHPTLTTLSPTMMVHELAEARAVISRELGTSIDAIAYPYGAVNAVAAHLAGAAGYRFGFTCDSRRARFSDDFLLLPRIEVRGDRSFADFVRAVE